MLIIVEFIDGPLGDYHLFSDEWASFEAILACGIYSLTKDGAIGQRFQIVSPAALQRLRSDGKTKGDEAELHVYEIAERLEADEEVKIRATFLPKRHSMKGPIPQ